MLEPASLFLLFIAALLWAATAIVEKKAVGKAPPLLVAFWSRLIGAVPLLILLLFLQPQDTSVRADLVWPIVLAGVFSAGWALTFFHGLGQERIALLYPIQKIDGVIAAIVAMALFGEAFMPVKGAALMLAFIGVLLACFSLGRQRKRGQGQEFQLLFSRGAMYAWLGAIFSGMNFALMILVAKVMPPAWAMFLYVVVAMAIMLLYLLATKRFGFVSVEQAIWIAPVGALGIAGLFCYYLSLKSVPASIGAPFSTTGSVLLLLIFSKLFLREKLVMREAIGIALIIFAILLLSVFA
ncbi:MAG: EamA family transporter [Candidatus Micrarchaeota archaeon]|nr:EamA family transporter [Candidatus Micrarchaeota archaeon]